MHRRTLIVEIALLALAGIVALALTIVAPKNKQPPLTFSPAILGGQPPDAIVLAKEDKDLAVALAVQPKGSTLTVVATIIGQDGTGTTGLDVSLGLKTSDGGTFNTKARACPVGCYETTFDTTARPVSATVIVNGPGASGTPLVFPMPTAWPPRPAMNLINKTETAYAKLKSLVTHERLATDPAHVQNTTYQAVAPDKLHTKNAKGAESIVIGKTRWDRQTGTTWQRTPQSSSVKAIAPYWGGTLEDATLLGATHINGQPAWIVSFAAPQFPAFFTIWIDKNTHRTLQLQMTASAHFMHHTYGPFNAQIEIHAPE